VGFVMRFQVIGPQTPAQSGSSHDRNAWILDARPERGRHRESRLCVELQLDVVGVAKGQPEPAAMRVVLGRPDLDAQIAEALRELFKALTPTRP
jgi:hypothetical protein